MRHSCVNPMKPVNQRTVDNFMRVVYSEQMVTWSGDVSKSKAIEQALQLVLEGIRRTLYLGELDDRAKLIALFEKYHQGYVDHMSIKEYILNRRAFQRRVTLVTGVPRFSERVSDLYSTRRNHIHFLATSNYW